VTMSPSWFVPSALASTSAHPLVSPTYPPGCSSPALPRKEYSACHLLF
jgi:hypothetical protein